MTGGTVKEIKSHEYRVGLTPSIVAELTALGYRVLVQTGAGEGSGISDDNFSQSGATIVSTAREVYERAEFLVKVKELQPEEYPLIQPGQIIFHYPHLPGASSHQVDAAVKSGSITIAYEGIVDEFGRRPGLDPMSEVAGEMAVLKMWHYLSACFGGKGMLLKDAKIMIVGLGIAGRAALRTAVDNHAYAHVFELEEKIEEVLNYPEVKNDRCEVHISNKQNIFEFLGDVDIIILAPAGCGKSAPLIIDNEMFKLIKPGTGLVDISTDEGGCTPFTTKEYHRSHKNPVEVVGSVHVYCVPNMPGGYPQTSTRMLTEAIRPYILEIANKRNPHTFSDPLKGAIWTFDGCITNLQVFNTLKSRFPQADWRYSNIFEKALASA